MYAPRRYKVLAEANRLKKGEQIIVQRTPQRNSFNKIKCKIRKEKSFSDEKILHNPYVLLLRTAHREVPKRETENKCLDSASPSLTSGGLFSAAAASRQLKSKQRKEAA